MTPRKHLTPAEAAVLEAWLPDGLTEDTRDIALCLFQTMVLEEAAHGEPDADPALRQARLQAMAYLAVQQLSDLSREKGGRPVYISKRVRQALFQGTRDREIFERWQHGETFAQLSTAYDLSDMRVRQIIDTLRREWFAQRQDRLPGL